jgi:hypothetical protein
MLLLAILGLVELGHPRPATAQVLPDSLVAEIRAGARRLSLPQDSTVVALFGPPNLPLVEVYLNGRGPFSFLVDLGANVVIVRRDVATAAQGEVVVERARTDIIRFADLQVGAARFEGVTVGAYDTLDVDGVLGYNLLRYAGFTLDYPRRRFVVHRRRLPPPNGVSILSYEVTDRLPFVRVGLGASSFRVNLDTGASEWMTIPPALKDSIRWATVPQPGPEVSNNQTGRTRVFVGQPVGPLTFGALRVPSPCIYVNPDAETAWLGSSSMRWAAWTFDPTSQRVEVSVPDDLPVGNSPCRGAG